MSRQPWSLGPMILILWMAVTMAGIAPQRAPTHTESEQELERYFTDPLSTLPQVVIRDSYTPANFGTGLETNQFLVRPLMPRIPPRTFLPFMQLIRPTFTLVTVPSSRGGTRPEFGDLPVFDVAVLPWPDRNRTTDWYRIRKTGSS